MTERYWCNEHQSILRPCKDCRIAELQRQVITLTSDFQQARITARTARERENEAKRLLSDAARKWVKECGKFKQRVAELEDEKKLSSQLHHAILDLEGSEGMTNAKFVKWTLWALEQHIRAWEKTAARQEKQEND